MCSNATSPVQPLIDTLIVGYGNSLRSDDGVGPAVVEQICRHLKLVGERRIGCRIEYQLTPELAAAVATVRRVIFVDASVRLAAGRVGVARIRGAAPAGGLGHQFTPPQILELSRLAFDAAPEAWVVEIGVASMEAGVGLSNPVARAADRLARHLVYYLRTGLRGGSGGTVPQNCYSAPPGVPVAGCTA